MRRVAAAFLLVLPLLAGLSTGARAQTPEPLTATLVPLANGLTALPEGAGVTFNIVLSRPLEADETVTLPLDVRGTATRGTDYRLVCVETATAGAGVCNGFDGTGPSITFHGAHLKSPRATGPLRIEAIEDNTVESAETVTLSLGGGPTQTITLRDAPSSVTLSFAVATSTRPEAGGLISLVLRVDAAPGGDIAVPLLFTDITATAGADYVRKATGTFEANGGTTNFIDLPIRDDALCEGDETFRVAIDASKLPSWVTLGSQGSMVVTIEDDDCTVTVSGVKDAREGEDAVFAVHVDPAPVRDMAIGYSVLENAGNSRQFVPSGSLGLGKSVTVPANQPSAEVTVPTLQAAGADPYGRVSVSLESGDQYTLGSPSFVSVRIFDDQYPAAHVRFTGVAGAARAPLDLASTDGSHEVNEGAGYVWVELELSQKPEFTTTVYVRERRSGTTATRGEDYKRGSSGWGWIAHFGTGRKARIRIPIVDDGINDDSETLTLDIYRADSPTSQFNKVVGTYTDSQGMTHDTRGFGANTGAIGSYKLTIRDYTSSQAGDDVDVWLSKSTYKVTEGAAFEGMVHIRQPRGVDTVISLTDTRGTAAPGTDYPAGPYSVTVPAGETGAAFTIRTLEDEEVELSTEAFRLRIDDASLPAGFVTPDGAGTPEEARVDIMENDYTFCFDRSSYTAREGEELAMRLTFSVPLPEGGWFKFTYTNQSAGDGDYTKVNVYPEVFWLPAGTEEYTLRVPTAADALFENNELFAIRADAPALPIGHSACEADVIIRDIAPEVDFQAAAYTAHEGRDAEVGIRVVERGTDDLAKLLKPVTLHIAAAGTGTATSGTDYAAGPWTLTIPAGASRGVLRIPVHADSANDDGETIDLEIRRMGTGTSHQDARLADANGNVLSDGLHVRVRRDSTDSLGAPLGWPAGAATVTIQNASGAPSGTPAVWIEAGPQVSEGSDATFTLKASPAPLAPLDVSVHVGESDVSHDLTDPFGTILTHLAPEHRGLRTATVDTTGSTVFTVPTRTNGAANTGSIRVALMDPSLVFGDREADYTPGKPSVAYVGVDAAAPEFPALRSAEQSAFAATPAPTEPVSNLRATVVDATSARVSWDAVPHATAYRVDWEGGGGDDRIGGSLNGVTGVSATIHHNAPAAMTLTIRVVPWHVDDDGEVRAHEALAATTALHVEGGGTGDSTGITRIASCVSDEQWSTVAGYYDSNANRSPNYGANWYRVLIAYRLARPEKALPGWEGAIAEPTAAYTADEAEDGEEVWSGWTPVREVLECLEEESAPAPAPPPPPPPPPAIAQGTCVSVAQWNTVKGYYDSNANRSPNYGANWYRVLIAYRQDRGDQTLPDWEGATAEPTAAFTAAAAETEESKWSGWTPVRIVLQCLEKTYGGGSTDSVIGGVPAVGKSGEVGNKNPGEARERNRWNPETGPRGFEPDEIPDFAASACVSPRLRSEAAARASETWRGASHVERWLRVGQTFSGGANDATVVTPAEAGFHAAAGQPGWLPVADALRCMEQQSLREALSR